MTNQVTEEILKHELLEAFTRVWETSIGLPIKPLDFNPEIKEEDNWIGGVVWIGGHWIGSVTIALPSSLAKIISASMLECEIADISKEQYQDTIKEIANMCAGNLKSSLPTPTGLGTPGIFKISKPLDLRNEFPTIISLNYLVEDIPLIIELHNLH